MTTFMPPGMRRGDPPPLHRFAPREFERMCSDLLREEKDIATSSLWGVSGQPQQGVDIVAECADGVHLEVGQCKCYKEFGPAQIRKACSDFVRHWEHWKSQDVRRFILFVACEVETTQSRKAILEQKRWFSERDIRFEVWDVLQIIAKLNPHVGIVRRYFEPPDYWASVLCAIPGGADSWGVAQRQHDYAAQLLSQEVNELAAAVSAMAAQQLEGARQAWREGRRDDAIRQIRGIRQDPGHWDPISPAVKAKVLRLEANFEIASGTPSAAASRLADEADALDPDGGGRLRAMLAYVDGGPAAGLQALERQGIDDPEFQAALLLEAGQVEVCLARIEEVEKQKPLSEEFLRLRVLALLASGKVAGARTVAARLLEQQPRWEAARLAAAEVDFFSALSPAALPGYVPAWPYPVDWTRIKRDDEAAARLRAAEAVFREVAEHPGHPGDELTNLQGWRIACLASDPERQGEAAELCRALLSAHPAHVPALMWTIARRYDIQVEPSLAALQECLEAPQCGLPENMALVHIALFLGRPEVAAQVLDRTHARFVEEGEPVVWTAWRLRSALEAEDPARADALLAQIVTDPALDALKPLHARVQAERTGDPVGLLDRFAAEYRETGDPGVLLEGCIAAADAEQWAFIAERSEELVERVATAEAVRLAVIAHFNAGAFDSALALLDGHLDLFRQRRLPPDLRRVRVRVQEALGVLPAAIMEAEALAREEPTSENLLELVRVYAFKGDLRGAVWVARRLKDRADLSPADALRLAATLHVEDMPLARDLWRRAAGSRLTPAAVEQAVDLGFRLGMDAEMGALLRRFYAQAEKGGRFRVLRSVQDALPVLRKAQESRARRAEFYRSGTAPIHLLASMDRIPLVDLYHRLLSTNGQEPAPLRQPPLRTRHGGRPAPGLSEERVQWRLHADVTAILLSQHLGVLGAVERTFGPIKIAAELIPSLVEMRTRLAHHQTTQVEAARVLDRAARSGLVAPATDDPLPQLLEEGWHAETGADWADLWHRAAAEDALVCDDLPLYQGGDLSRPVELPEVVLARVVEPVGIASALLDLEAITQDAHSAAVAQLPEPGHAAGTARPLPGQRIHCAPGAAGILAQIGVLEAACRAFQVIVPREDLQEAKALLLATATREAEDRWLAELVQRLSEGIDAETYEVIRAVPPAPSFDADDDDEEDEPDDRTMASLRALLRFEARPGDVAWFDDRYMTGFLHREGCPIVDTVEVLAALASAGGITRADYFHYLHRMRAENVRLVAPSGEELSYQLRRARVDGGQLVETPELNVLRRYVAATILDGRTLQRAFTPEGFPAERHELTYVLALQNALDEALTGLWEDEKMSEPERRARGEWLVRSLFLDIGSGRGVVGLHEPHEDDRYHLALSLAGFVVRGLFMGGAFATEPAPAVQGYLEWVTAFLLQPRFEADPLLASAVAHVLGQQMLDVGRTLPPDVRALRTIALQRLFDRLPAALRDVLAKDAEFMKEAGIVVRGITQVAGFEFSAPSFARAVEKAANGSSARVALLNGKGSVRVLPSRDPTARHAIQLGRGRERWTVVYEDPVFSVMRDSVAERTEALRALRRYFVGSDAEFEQAAARVATLSDPYQRVTEVEAWRATSPVHHYETLTSRISGHDPTIRTTELRPADLDAFVRAHGLTTELESGEAITAASGAAVRKWIESEGIGGAFLRVCGFPVPLPESILDEFARAGPGDRRQVVRDLLRSTGSPLARIHLLHLMASAPTEFRRLSRFVVRCLLSERGEVDFRAFAAMLDHAEAEFTDPATDSWSPALRLAMVWSHASRLFDAMWRARAKLEVAPEMFEQAQRRVVARLFARDAAYRGDAAHPKRLGRPSFLVTGLGYALRAVPDLARSIVPPAALMGLLAPGEESNRQVDVGILRDPSLDRDALGSFLAADRGAAIYTLTGDATADELSAAGRRAFAEEALDGLEESVSAEGWARLHSVVGENPFYLELRGRLERLLLQIGFVELHSSSPEEVRLPLLIASVQAGHWGGPELRAHVEDALAGIAGSLPTDAGDTDVEMAANMLMDFTLRLAWGRSGPRETAGEFARVARRLLDHCPRLAAHWRVAAERLWAEVPAPCAWPLAELLVRVRAE
ncbi:MAG: hypothetical protein AB1941_00350 [Gemmatimonadota bacterium]